MFDLTFLGTAASTPSAERGLPALLVGAGRRRFLIDCGEGTQRQLLRAGTGFRRLGHILLTHAHLDHVLGLGGLVATLGLFDVRTPLSICGSGEMIRFVEQYLASLYPLPRAPVPLQFIELQPGPIVSSGEFSVTCFPVRHRGTESLGYRFDTKPRGHVRADRLVALGVPAGPLRAQLAAGQPVVLPDGRHIEPDMVQGPPAVGASLAVVGDAEEVESLVAPVSRADALVIEATFLEADAALAIERGHLTAAQAGRLAAAADVGSLYLTHISGRYDPAAVAAEAGQFFANVSVVNDFDRVTVTVVSREAAAPHPPRSD
jgi:ribonuclease Z